MPRFKDATGREWTLRITCATLQHFEEKTGANIFDPKVLSGIDKSLGKMCTLAYFACGEQARKLNISQEEFGEGIDSDLLMIAMIEAVGEALMLFFQSRQSQDQKAADSASRGHGSKSTK